MLILFKIDNGQNQNCIFASVLHQLKGMPADYHLKCLWHQANQKPNSHERIAQSEFIFCYIYFLTTNIISQKLLQCAPYTYQTLFHKKIYSVCSLLTKHFFTKTLTVFALYLPNIISQKLLQSALCTYQTLFHKIFYSEHSVLTKHYFTKNIILNKNFYWDILATKLKYYGYTFGQMVEQMLNEAQATPHIDIVLAALRLFPNLPIAVLKTKYQTTTTKNRAKKLWEAY